MKCILIVDDNSIMRHSLRALLEREPEWTVCGEAGDGRDAILQAQKLHPDLIVLDLSMPVMNGLEAGRILSQIMPAVPLVMWTNLTPDIVEPEALSAGFRLVRSKSEGGVALVSGIRTLLAA